MAPEASSELALRYAAVRRMLARLTAFPGWALVKGWRDPASSAGDVDLLVEPHAVASLGSAIIHFLKDGADAVTTAFQCEHIPGVPRIIAHAPGFGFSSGLFEVDLATVLPFRGYPAVTLARMHRFVVWDGDGVPRLDDPAAEALRFLSRLGWWRSAPPEPSPESCAVLEHLLGPALARMCLGRTPSVGAAVVSTVMVARALVKEPRLFGQRIAFRLDEALRGPACPFDPRRGRGARAVGDPTSLRWRGERSGHEVVI